MKPYLTEALHPFLSNLLVIRLQDTYDIAECPFWYP